MRRNSQVLHVILVDILACRYSLYVHWQRSHTIKKRKFISLCTAQSDEHRGPEPGTRLVHPPDRPPSQRAAAQLAISSNLQSNDIASAGVTTFSTVHFVSECALWKCGDVARDMLSGPSSIPYPRPRTPTAASGPGVYGKAFRRYQRYSWF